jgi:hypothetical protein
LLFWKYKDYESFSIGCKRRDDKIIFVPNQFDPLMTRAMEQIGAGLEKIVAGSLRRSPEGQGPMLAWAVACGQAVAARTRAVDFAQGVLRVEVPDAGWRAELQALAPQYLAVVNRYVAESVRRIEFVIVDKAAGEGARPTRT